MTRIYFLTGMDKIKYFGFIFLLYCLCIPWAKCGPVFLREKRSLQNLPSASHDSGDLTDVSDTGNDRHTDSEAVVGHDHVGHVDVRPVSAGQGQADQSLHDHSDTDDGVGQDHDSARHGHDDFPNDEESAVIDHDGVLDPLNDGAQGLDSDPGDVSAGAHASNEQQTLLGQGSVVGHLDPVQDQGDAGGSHDRVSDSGTDTDSSVFPDSAVSAQDGVRHSQSAVSSHDSQNSPVLDPDQGVISDDGTVGMHDTGIVDHNAAIADSHQSYGLHDNDIVSGIFDSSLQTDDNTYDDADAADDYLLPDSVVDSHPSVLDRDDSALQSHSDSDHSLSHNTGDITDTHTSNNGSGVIATGIHSNNNNNDIIDDHHGSDSSIADHNDLQGDHNTQDIHTGESGGSVDGHGTGHNTGVQIDSGSSHLDRHETLDGHESQLDHHNTDLDGQVDNLDRLDNLGDNDVVRVNPDSDLDTGSGGEIHIPETDHAHNEGTESGHSEGSQSGTETGGETQHVSGEHGQAVPIPSHSLPPSHAGHEVHSRGEPDIMPNSGEGPVIDKNGGVHGQSYHEGEGHERPAGPRHTIRHTLRLTSGTTSNRPEPPETPHSEHSESSSTTVKVLILPTPVQPEIVGGENRTDHHDDHDGDGHASEGHPISVSTTPGEAQEIPGDGNEGPRVAITTTPDRIHEAEGHSEGHLVTITTTPTAHHEGEGHEIEGHTGGDEGEGHVHTANQSSSQHHDMENHGDTDETGDKLHKGQNKDGQKLSSFLFSSESHQLQPSAFIHGLHSSGSSLYETPLETGREHYTSPSLQITEQPVTSSKGTEIESSRVSLATEVQSSYGSSLEYIGKSSYLVTEESSNLIVTESYFPHSDTVLLFSSSGLTTKSSFDHEPVHVSNLVTDALPISSTVILSSTEGLESSVNVPSLSSRSSNLSEIVMHSKTSTLPELHPTQVFAESSSRLKTLTTIVSVGNLETLSSSSVNVSASLPILPSKFLDITTTGRYDVDSNSMFSAMNNSSGSVTMSVGVPTYNPPRITEKPREQSVVIESASSSRTHRPLTSLFTRPTEITTPRQSPIIGPHVSGRPQTSISSSVSALVNVSSLFSGMLSASSTLYSPSIGSNTGTTSSQGTKLSSSSYGSTAGFNTTIGTATNYTTRLGSLRPTTRNTTIGSVSGISTWSQTITTVSRPNESVNRHSTRVRPIIPTAVKSTFTPLLTTLITTKRKNLTSTLTTLTPEKPITYTSVSLSTPSQRTNRSQYTTTNRHIGSLSTPTQRTNSSPYATTDRHIGSSSTPSRRINSSGFTTNRHIPSWSTPSRRNNGSHYTTTNRRTQSNRPVVTERTTLVPIHVGKSTVASVASTTPPVFVQIELRMNWMEFCSSKMYFITELRQIIHTEKKIVVTEEQFRISNMPSENCRMEDFFEEENILVHVYIVDEKGRVDISLTIDLSTVIEKGLESSNSHFKDKINSYYKKFTRQFVGARLYGTGQATSPPRRKSPVSEAQSSPGVTMVTIIASVGGACCVVLVILQIMIRRRILQKKLRPYVSGQRASLQSMDHVALGVIPKSRPDSGYWNPALEEEEIPEPSEHSHLVNFAGLANFSLDKNGIYEEFQMIPFETPDKSEIPIGIEEKNRFANVLPFKATRVRLQKKEGIDDSDYINANYIKGYKKGGSVYIATQSPMMNTAEDFWRMIWEQGSRVVLMLNPLSETGKPKMCTMYWPDGEGSESVKQFGDFAVTLKKRDVQQDYIESTLQLRDMEWTIKQDYKKTIFSYWRLEPIYEQPPDHTKNNQYQNHHLRMRNLKREIHQFWFTTWPETGLPEPLAFVKFILDARPRYEDTGTPVVVHCGPGTGRTGVLIAIDVCMRMFEDKRRVDVLQCVHQMRKERAGAVQTRDQYALIYQALNEYAVILSSPSISTRSSVITLHAML